MMKLPIQIPAFPPARESVAKTLTAESLRAAALAAADSAVVLGLAALARPGDPVRKELAEAAVKAQPSQSPVAAVLTLVLDRIDMDAVAEVLATDPNNALGYYLHGALLHAENREPEALASFRKAAACSELRCYDSTVGDGVFKAVDSLGFQGLCRLCALSWMASRWTNFSSVAFQPTYNAVSELAKDADRATRAELAELLLVMAGHLFATNFTNRFFAQRAAEAALVLKAELAADESPVKRRGYAAAVYGMVMPLFNVPGLKEWWQHSPQRLAQELPGSIHEAFAAADPNLAGAGMIGEAQANVPESDRSAFKAARERVTQTARRLLDLALPNTDELMRPYFKELTRIEPSAGPAPLWGGSAVGELMNKQPELLQAAAALNEAMAALWTAGENDPSRKNIGRMMEIGMALYHYACQHEQTYPEKLESLIEGGYLKSPLEAKSLRTGRPYVYVAGGEKIPAKANDRAQFVLLYDDAPDAHGASDCVTAFPSGGAIPQDLLKAQLKRRGK